MSAEISSIAEFLKEVEQHKIGMFFRGHSESSWQLLPSLARLDFDKLDAVYGEWKDVEISIIGEFQRLATPYITREPENNLEWIIHAQHYGVPTRILDWTTNPLKALFFSVSDPNKDDFDGTVYMMTPGETSISSRFVNERENTFVSFFPLHVNDRIIAQESCFTLFPLPDGRSKFVEIKEPTSPLKEVLSLKKIIISRNSKKTIRKKLIQYGVSYRMIFPGLEGIAKSLREQYGAEYV